MKIESGILKQLVLYCKSQWYDFSHIHPSLLGFKRKRLETLIEIERFIGQQLDKRRLDHQRWILIDLKDPEQDAVYVHSKNPNAANYPAEFEKGRTTAKNQRKYSSILKMMGSQGYQAFKVKGSQAIIGMRPGVAPDLALKAKGKK